MQKCQLTNGSMNIPVTIRTLGETRRKMLDVFFLTGLRLVGTVRVPSRKSPHHDQQQLLWNCKTFVTVIGSFLVLLAGVYGEGTGEG